MITLREAIKLTKIISPGELLFLRPVGRTAAGFAREAKAFTLKEVLEKFDLRAVKVHEITPCLDGFIFEGFEFVVSGPRFDEKD